MTKFNDTLLRAAKGEKIEHTPVWFMRQAGRSQPEYRKIKEKYSLEEITHQPELCSYVTKLPVDQYDVDAAILYKDIVTPLPGLGIDVKIKSGVGPVIHNPIRSVQDVTNLGELSPEDDIPFVLETIKILTKEQLNVPLIGFAGAPFTLASYMIEGGPSKGYHLTKSFMKNEPIAWFTLMDKLEEMTVTYIQAQVAAGAKAFQIFDSWVGALSVEDYRIFVKPTMTRIFAKLRDLNVPMITFGVGASHLLEDWNELPVDVLGLDWRTSIEEAEARGVRRTVQGNLDPSLLLADWPLIEEAAKRIVEQGVAHGKNGSHIFNLGHGVFPSVQPDTLKRLTAFVHEYSATLRREQ